MGYLSCTRRADSGTAGRQESMSAWGRVFSWATSQDSGPSLFHALAGHAPVSFPVSWHSSSSSIQIHTQPELTCWAQAKTAPLQTGRHWCFNASAERRRSDAWQEDLAPPNSTGSKSHLQIQQLLQKLSRLKTNSVPQGVFRACPSTRVPVLSSAETDFNKSACRAWR